MNAGSGAPAFGALHGIFPLCAAPIALFGFHERGEALVAATPGAKIVGTGPESGGEAGEISRAQRGGLRDLRADDGDAEDIGLELHEQIVDGGAAIDAQRTQWRSSLAF